MGSLIKHVPKQYRVFQPIPDFPSRRILYIQWLYRPHALGLKEAGKTSFTSFTKGLKMALTMEPISAPRARTLSNAAERAAIIAYKKWEAAKGSRWMPLRTAKLLCDLEPAKRILQAYNPVNKMNMDTQPTSDDVNSIDWSTRTASRDSPFTKPVAPGASRFQTRW